MNKTLGKLKLRASYIIATLVTFVQLTYTSAGKAIEASIHYNSHYKDMLNI